MSAQKAASCQLSADSSPWESFPPEVSRRDLMALLRRHLAPLDPDEVARAVIANRRSVEDWQAGHTLPNVVSWERLRRWLPGLAADLHRLEAADHAALAALAAQYGPRARPQDGD